MRQKCPFPNFKTPSKGIHKRKSLSLFYFSSKETNHICSTSTYIKPNEGFQKLEPIAKKICLSKLNYNPKSNDKKSDWLKIHEEKAPPDKLRRSLEFNRENVINYRCAKKSEASFMSNEMKELFKKGLSESHYEQMQNPKKKGTNIKNMLKKNIEMTQKKDTKKIILKQDLFEREKDSYQKNLKKEMISCLENVNRDLKMKYMKKISLTTDNLFSDKYKYNDSLINKNYFIDYRVYRPDVVRFITSENLPPITSENLVENTPHSHYYKVSPRNMNLMIKFKRTIISCAFKYKRSNLSFKEIQESKAIFKKPYELQKSRYFFNCVSDGNNEEVKEMLDQNKFYVHCFNEARQTPLHIAAKKNNGEMIKTLVDYGADVNSVDFIGRSPLHIAALHNHFVAAKTLLFEYSDPMLFTDCKNSPKQFSAVKSSIYIMLYFAEKLHKLHRDYYSYKIYQRIINGLNFIIANYSLK